VRVGQQPLKILGLLLEHPRKLRTREEIRERLWGTITFVNFEQSINKAVYHLREVLGDVSSNPRYVETVAGSRYRFIYFAREPDGSERVRGRRVPLVAALPFVREESDPELEILLHRILNALIDTISREAGMRVLPYAAVKHCWESDPDPQSVGHRLGVDFVAPGEIIRQGDELFLHSGLVEVGSGIQLRGAEFRQLYAEAVKCPELLGTMVADQLRPFIMHRSGREKKEEEV